MTEISGVIKKISLSTEYPASVFMQQVDHVILMDLPFSDNILFNYHTKRQEIINYAIQVSNKASSHYFFDSGSDTSIYLLYDFKNLDQWNSVINNDLMTNYQVVKQQIYEKLGWIDHGFKIIEDYTLIDPVAFKESLINGAAGAEIIWNSIT